MANAPKEYASATRTTPDWKGLEPGLYEVIDNKIVPVDGDHLKKASDHAADRVLAAVRKLIDK
jgi:hypothetical protein